MLEWFLIILSAVGMGRIAYSEGRSPIVWGALTGVLCFLCVLFIPLPLLNIGIGLAASFIIMTVTKMIQND